MLSALSTYVLLGLCLLVFAGSFFMNSPKAPAGVRKLAKFSAIAQLVAMLGAYFVVRPGGSADVASLKAKAKAEQKLVFLSFHSNH